jgi:hypothetical protein
MKLWLSALGYFNRTAFASAAYLADFGPIAAVLLSATCVGNDGKQCPIFHGSLAPELFSSTRPDLFDHTCSASKFQNLLLRSNCLTWTHTINLLSYYDTSVQICDSIMKTLSNTRYSCRSVRTLRISVRDSHDQSPFLSFIENHCTVLEQLELQIERRIDLSFLVKRAQTLESLKLVLKKQGTLPSTVMTVPFDRLSHLRKLMLDDLLEKNSFEHLSKCRSIEVLEIRSHSSIVSDADFLHFKKLVNLQELSIDFSIEHITSECFDEVLSSLPFLRKFHVGKMMSETLFPHLPMCPLDDFSCSGGFTDELIQRMSQIKTLKTLKSVTYLANMDALDWKPLTTLPVLHSLLKIPTSQMSLESVKIICSISSLRILQFFGDGIVDDWFEPISIMIHLQELDCDYAVKVTGCGLHHIYEMKSLHKLSLFGNLRDCRMPHLAELQKRLPWLTLEPRHLQLGLNAYLKLQEKKNISQ